MRILFLSGWFPYPPDNGSRIRVFNLIKQLSREHEVTLLSFAEGAVSGDRLARMRSLCQAVYTVPYKEFAPRRWRAILGFLTPSPRSVADTYSPQMEALVSKVAGSNSFDIAITSEMRTAPYARFVRGVPRVFEDIELAWIWEQFSAQTDLLRKARYALTWYKTSYFMRRLLRVFDACTVVSEQERGYLQRAVPKHPPIATVPNGVDAKYYSDDFGLPRANTLIHTGALTYSANLDAMCFFLNGIYPLIKARHPEAELRITGRTDGVTLSHLRGDGVIFTGYLGDIRPAIAQSWISIVPLRTGGGTRLKILEAMALGTPVVSTSKGAEGLEVTSGKDILLADTPERFAEAVLSLLDDGALRARLAENGRRLVAERYHWEQIGSVLERLLHEVAEERSKG